MDINDYALLLKSTLKDRIDEVIRLNEYKGNLYKLILKAYEKRDGHLLVKTIQDSYITLKRQKEVVFINVTDIRNIYIVNLAKISNYIWTPIPAPNNTYFDCHVFKDIIN